ncbi:uncharacterized protein BYT42DRAFT_571204 [Radiomyces spectabilis]|uniref:uncharacterized protein n=1 Tax=Radiomyces spectabilis TaxID=64574 RepID=UPI00221E90F0|nr:uncharacterized protein BYT42DRAFT_571204 [Radiomyces spectabilis]KAI8377679.1 hypothetical protein BYT42DRAFT_571204 [Radiomyces spectabilis]
MALTGGRRHAVFLFWCPGARLSFRRRFVLPDEYFLSCLCPFLNVVVFYDLSFLVTGDIFGLFLVLSWSVIAGYSRLRTSGRTALSSGYGKLKWQM